MKGSKAIALILSEGNTAEHCPAENVTYLTKLPSASKRLTFFSETEDYEWRLI